MSPKSLPGDVLYLIFGLLETHKDLPFCTLVSRAWLFPSRRHLFRRIRIAYNDPRPGRNIFGFLEYLRESPHVHEDIRDLDITHKSPSQAPHFKLQFKDLSEILGKLPFLRSLHLHGLSFLKCRSPEKLISNPFELEELVVKGVGKEVGAVGSLVTLLSLFSDVERLHVDFLFEGIKTTKEFEQQTRSYKFPPWLRIRSLRTEGFTHEVVLFAIIKNTPSLQRITSLDVICPRTGDRVSLVSLLEAAGPQIRDLKISVRNLLLCGRSAKQALEARYEKKIVTLCSSIRSLTLRIEGCPRLNPPPPFPSEPNSSTWCRAMDILHHLPDSTERLALVLQGKHDCWENFSPTDWVKVGKRLRHLQQVTVEFPSGRTVVGRELGQRVQRTLAGVLRDGVLSFIDTSYH